MGPGIPPSASAAVLFGSVDRGAAQGWSDLVHSVFMRLYYLRNERLLSPLFPHFGPDSDNGQTSKTCDVCK